MNILDKIVAQKAKEISLKETALPIKILKDMPLYARECVSISKSLKASNCIPIIAEFKRRSPSKSVINQTMSVEDVATNYNKVKFAGMSVLTDQHFFGGCLDDLLTARAHFNQAILRKDFTISAYQLHEAKAFGADFILLIAAVLSEIQLKDLTQQAQDLGLEVLVEVHSQEDLEKSMTCQPNLMGINNRNLKTFEVDIANSLKLAAQLPKSQLRISESGISDPQTINKLNKQGFDGYLIGEQFMKSSLDNFQVNLNAFINQLEHEN